MQDQKPHEQSLRIRHWTSHQVNARIQDARQLRFLDNETPNLTMVLCDSEEVRYPSRFGFFVQRVSSRKKAGNDSDALKNVDPMFGYELPYPITTIIPQRRAAVNVSRRSECQPSRAATSAAGSGRFARPARSSLQT